MPLNWLILFMYMLLILLLIMVSLNYLMIYKNKFMGEVKLFKFNKFIWMW